MLRGFILKIGTFSGLKYDTLDIWRKTPMDVKKCKKISKNPVDNPNPVNCKV